MSEGKLNPVAWMEGMFLRPQHLQQRDLWAEERLRYHLHALTPFHWGVADLQLDTEALNAGRVVVSRLEAILRDGTVVRLDDNAFLEPRKFDTTRKAVEVWLGLRQLSSTDANVGYEGNGASYSRWTTRDVSLPDWTRGGGHADVALLYPNLRLLLSGEEKERELYESFKLAEIVATGDTKRPFAVSSNFAPPLLTVQASVTLKTELEEILNQLTARVRAAAAQTKSLTVPALPKFWMRYTLARGTPVVRHLLRTGHTSPFDLFGVLVEITGALGALRHEQAVDLPAYDHEDPLTSFRKLIRFLKDELDRIVPDNFRRLPLEFDPAIQCYVARRISMHLLDPNNTYYLALHASIESEELAQLISVHAKSGAPGELRQVFIPAALKGLRLDRLPGAPVEIESMPGHLYFKLDQHTARGAMWRNVQQEGAFGLFLGRLHDARAYLYVVTPEVDR